MTRKEFIRNLSYDEKVQILKEYKDSGAPDLVALQICDLNIVDGSWKKRCNELYQSVGVDNYTLLVFARDVAEEVAFESIELLKNLVPIRLDGKDL